MIIVLVLLLLRGADGVWKKRKITELATPDTFHSNPSLIWEFYSHKRELASTKVHVCLDESILIRGSRSAA